MKPLALVGRAIDHASRVRDVVFDPFLGSGTTLIAAEQTERICYGAEIDPRYVDVIVQRWENLTGEKAARPR
jgi:DNA modification methylase